MGSRQSHLRAVVNRDGAAILNAGAGKIFTLNATGAFIWQAVERGEPTENVALELANRTGAEIEVVRQDVAEFIESLTKQNLLPK